jgi:molybdate transport system substrate-binding protein
MMVDMRRIVVLMSLALLMLAGGCDHAREEPVVVVFAAASCTDLVTAAAERFEDETGARVMCSFASSSTLARQIEAGAPADVFLSAHPQWVDRLGDEDLVQPGTRIDLLMNRLVLVGTKDESASNETDGHLTRPPAVDRFAIGDPAHVPAGIYAKQALESLGWWEEIEDRIITAPDVRAALRLVERGEAGAGIIYASDAVRSDRVRIRMTIPAEAHETIRYPLVLLRGASGEARDFYERLSQVDAAFAESFGFARASSVVGEAVGP